MGVPYDVFTGAFLSKVTDYDFPIRDYERSGVIDGFMKRAVTVFQNVCIYDLIATADDAVREFDVEVEPEDMDELIDIISEGMIVQWMKPYVYRQENLENILNTKDFTSYSPATLLRQVSESYKSAKREYTNMVREYSYNHGDLTDLHL